MQGLTKLEKETNNLVLLAVGVAPECSCDSSMESPIRFVEDLAIASDGTIYFTDATDVPLALDLDVLRAVELTVFQASSPLKSHRIGPAA